MTGDGPRQTPFRDRRPLASGVWSCLSDGPSIPVALVLVPLPGLLASLVPDEDDVLVAERRIVGAMRTRKKFSVRSATTYATTCSITALVSFTWPSSVDRLDTWNLAACSALWGPISILEIAVRNAIHERLVERAGRGDWWADPHIQFCRNEQEAIDSAITTLQRRGTPEPSSDQVVAATSFGLWVGLTGAGVPRDRLLSYETTLWQPRLQHAFPHRGDRRRKYIHACLDDVRVLRNRIAHHEPIYNSPLQNVYVDILEIAGMIHSDARGFIESHNRAQEVTDHYRDALTTEIRL